MDDHRRDYRNLLRLCGALLAAPFRWRHRSPWLVFALLLAFWGTVAVKGELTEYLSGDSWEHGWPYSIVTYTYWKGQVIESPLLYRQGDIDWSAAALDLVVVLAIAAAGAVVWEWRRRRARSAWQFTLRNLFFATAVVAVALGYGRSVYQTDRREAQLEESLGKQDLYVTREYVGPRWLARLFGRDALPWHRITSIDLMLSHGIDDDDKHWRQLLEEALPELQQLSSLKTFEAGCIQDFSIVASLVSELRNVTTIQSIALPGSAAELDCLATMPRLARLDFETVADPAALTFLAKCPAIRELRFGKEDEAILRQVFACHELEVLELSNTYLSEPSFTMIASMSRLRELAIKCEVTYGDEGDIPIRPYLDTPISVDSLRRIAALPRLERLELQEARADAGGFQELGKSATLRELDLYSTNLNNEDLAALRPARRLVEIDIGSTDVTDAGLLVLADFPALRFVDLSYTFTTPAGRDALQRKCPQLSIFCNGSRTQDDEEESEEAEVEPEVPEIGSD